MFVSNLNAHDAIKFGDRYLIQLTSGDYFVKGEKYTSPYKSQHMVEKLEDIATLVKQSQTLIHFKDSDGNVVDCVEEYKTLMSELSTLPSYNGKYEYPDLETEFHYRSHLEKFEKLTPVYHQPEPLMQPIQFKVVGSMEDTGSVYIETSLTYGALSFFGRGPYKVKVGLIAKDIYADYSKRYEGFTNSSHSNIEFSQYKSKYLFANHKTDSVTKEDSFLIFTTLEEAQQAEKKTREFITRIFEHTVNPVLITKEHIDAMEVEKDLASIRHNVALLDVKKNSDSSKRHLLTMLDKLSAKFKSLKND